MSRWLSAAFLAFSSALGGETLLLLRSQHEAAEASLREDFRVLAFLSPGLDAGRLRVIEEKARALPEAAGASLRSGVDALVVLREREPDFADSLLLLGEEHLPAAVEVSLAADAFGRAAEAAAALSAIDGVSDVRYKAGQARAVLQAQFHSRFIGLILDLLALGLGLFLAAWLWSARARPGRIGPAAAAAALAGMALPALLALPARGAAGGWAWPGFGAQLAVFASSWLAALALAPCEP